MPPMIETRQTPARRPRVLAEAAAGRCSILSPRRARRCALHVDLTLLLPFLSSSSSFFSSSSSFRSPPSSPLSQTCFFARRRRRAQEAPEARGSTPIAAIRAASPSHAYTRLAFRDARRAHPLHPFCPPPSLSIAFERAAEACKRDRGGLALASLLRQVGDEWK